ncbi:hypothetical protein LCL89_15410 [Halobacillus yeomjeoni]|uniref:Uncharacterized protein n=1 Tax=Halobacillus yeomjeoni TaxID=311194 RepID=A0A931HVG3_9BACI|nr:hypothetical protein [Halobacillus yeomjeoni]MBH0230537.1 hypothetical protein [Halobacillus yeomjeoni]MCA0985422.1 hypothetical protein [Halobacillus yeomjeoni]
MRHPHENYIKAQLATLLLAVFLAVLGLFQLDHQWIILLMFYVLATSFLFEALVESKKQQMVNSIIQLLRALIIVLFTTILYF